MQSDPLIEGIIKNIPQLKDILTIQALRSQRVFRITCRHQSYTLKIFPPHNRNHRALFHEVRPLLPFHTPNPAFFRIGENNVAIYEFIEGEPLTESLLPEAAKLMAMLHLTKVSPRPLEPDLDLSFFFDYCAAWEYGAPLQKIWEALDFSYRELVPCGLVHGDFSYSNVCVHKNTLSLIDWDKIRYGILLDDIGFAQIDYGFDAQGNFNETAFASFLASYETLRPLTSLEKKHLRTHVLRCLIETAFILYASPQEHTPDPNALAKRIQTLYLPENPYQDILVNNTLLAHGRGQACAPRYAALQKVFSLYTSPFTLLDIGAAEGYFSFRAAYDYGARATLIEDPHYENHLLERLCSINTKAQVTLLPKRITAEELMELTHSTHFDIVLALNILHHFGPTWEKAYEALLKLGDHLILETPPTGDVGACGQSLLSPINQRLDQEFATLLGQFTRHTDPSLTDRLLWIQPQCYLFLAQAQ